MNILRPPMRTFGPPQVPISQRYTPPCARCRRMAGSAVLSVLLGLTAWTASWPIWSPPPTRPAHVQSTNCAPNCPECFKIHSGGTPGGSVGIRV